MPAPASLAMSALRGLCPSPLTLRAVSISTIPPVPTISTEAATSRIEEPFSLHLQGLAPGQDLTLQPVEDSVSLTVLASCVRSRLGLSLVENLQDTVL